MGLSGEVRFVLVNPNTSVETTRLMVESAVEALPDRVEVVGLTAPSGAALITEPAALARAADVVAGMAGDIASLRPDAVIVSAFGDPGAEALRRHLACPVIGIGAASIAAAAALGPFGIVTTTPGLVALIDAMVEREGAAHLYRGVTLTTGEPAEVMADPDILLERLRAACGRAAEAGVKSLIIGGGPLAGAARRLDGHTPVRLVAPLHAAAAASFAALGARRPPPP
jgi:Asp/Glu/hydantoin racemase